MTQEIWKDIDGISGYQVSNIGNVRNIDGKYAVTDWHEWVKDLVKRQVRPYKKRIRKALWKRGKYRKRKYW